MTMARADGRVVIKNWPLLVAQSAMPLLVATVAAVATAYTLVIGVTKGPVNYLVSAAPGLVGIGLAWLAYRTLTLRVTIDSDGLEMRNRRRTQRVSWPAVEGFATQSSPARRSGTWWHVVVVLRPTGEVVRLQAVRSKNHLYGEATAAHLRSLAPPRP